MRLAAHHAIDKAALSRAFYGDAAVPLSHARDAGHARATWTDFRFKYDPNMAKQLLAKSGFGPEKPAKIGFATTNGQFPERLRHRARDRSRCGSSVGIEADSR